MDISTEEVDDPNRTATCAELQAGQLSEAELLSLSILKVRRLLNYSSVQTCCPCDLLNLSLSHELVWLIYIENCNILSSFYLILIVDG